jgi:hypothetical protein
MVVRTVVVAVTVAVPVVDGRRSKHVLIVTVTMVMTVIVTVAVTVPMVQVNSNTASRG